MRICLIGACGHTKQVYRYLTARGSVSFCGFAPESVYEMPPLFLDESVPRYSDYLEMLDTLHPDLAIVSPVFAHTGRVIIACAERGIDVYAEKPVAASLEELAQVEAAVLGSGIRFCAMHDLRYLPAFYHGARLVRAGAIGEVRMVTAQKSYKYGVRPAWYSDRRLYGGTIPWVGIHAIDWIYHFTGRRFVSVTAQSMGESPELEAMAQFCMEGGVMSSFHLDYDRPESAPTHGDDRIRCVGTKGVLEVRDGRIYLMNEKGCSTIEPDQAPNLTEEFLRGGESIPPQEIFYLTGVAIAARDAADTQTRIELPK